MSERISLQAKRTATIGDVKSGSSVAAQLNAALGGDREAWDNIVSDYANLLWWIARSHKLDDATAADVVQTVWLQLVQYGGSIRDPDRLASWLATTARREAQRRLTISRRHLPTDLNNDGQARTQVGPEEHVVDDELTAAALAAFYTLGPNCQKLMSLLCEVPTKSYVEISAILDIPVGSIGPSRQRCLATLRVELRGLGF